MRIGIVGGTGREGRGLALRWARAGHAVAVGSRDAARAAESARALGEEAAKTGAIAGTITGSDNLTVARDAEILLVSVPYGAHDETFKSLVPVLSGQIVIDITVPLKPPKVREVALPPGASAALEAQVLLGDKGRVVATLHHVSSVHLGDPDHTIDCDVLVCSDDATARETVVGLIGDLGLRGLDAGVLKNAIALEALTPVLLHFNKRYGSAGAGIRITGL